MPMDKIDHVVVLMLENRSFDSMLGWLYEHDSATVKNIPAAQAGDTYRGLQSVDLSKFVNKALGGTLSVQPTRGAAGFTVPTVDPGEQFDHVNQQFFGTNSPQPGQPATMTGVVADFVEVLQERKLSNTDIASLAGQVMQSFTPSQLPVLSQLARHYAVSDAWYASVPSQTNPNRAFLLCGTSNGMVNNGFLETSPQAPPIEKALGMPIGDDRVDALTIFNALDQAQKDWAVFWQTSYLPRKMSTLIGILQALIAFLNALKESPITYAPTIVLDAALAMLAIFKQLGPAELSYLRELSAGDLNSSYTWRLFPQIQKIHSAAQNFQSLDDFHTRARAGTLPAFSYIEPFWSISRATTGNSLGERLVSALGNDYHPPSNLLVGEEFVKDVYTSLISNSDAWHRTLLLITFDEFVGTFDHVTDSLGPAAVNPPWGSGKAPSCEEGFKFDRLGGRCPTILVSPYIQKGTVFRSTTSVPYDHTSVIATAMKWIGKSGDTTNFGTRAASAPTFEAVLTLPAPRTDEAVLPFLDSVRLNGDPLCYGQSFWLQNTSGDYLSSAYPTMKVAGGGAVVPQDGTDLLADIGVAAYFPRYGSGETTTVTLVSHLPDAGPQVSHGDKVRLVSREPQLGSRNVLGAWHDSYDCYYYDEYIDGDNADRQTWTIQKLDLSKGYGVRYGDQVYLCSASSEYSGYRLTRDTRVFNTDNWITTASNGKDSWTIVPAPARVGQGSRFWEQLPKLMSLNACPGGGGRGLVLWARDFGNMLWSAYQDKPNGTWMGWSSGWGGGIPGGAGPVVTALQNQTELTQMWSIVNRQLWSRSQSSPAGGWPGWSQWSNAPASIQQAAACPEGGTRCVRVWVIDATFTLQCNYLDKPGGSWVGWSGPAWNGAPGNLQNVTAVLQADGTIRVWVADRRTTVYTTAQSTPGGDDWETWTEVGTFTSPGIELAACQIADGGLQLWANAGGSLHSTYQPAPGEDWTPWDPPADQRSKQGWEGTGWLAMLSLTAAAQPGGEAGVWVLDSASNVHHKAQTGGVWGDWSPSF